MLGLLELRKTKRRLKVECRVGFVQAQTPLLKEIRIRTVSITAVNIGHRPVQIDEAGFEMTDGQWLIPIPYDPHFGDYPLPARLEDGESVSVLMNYERIEKATKKEGAELLYTAALVKDSEGNMYRADMPDFLKEQGLAR